jgi:hypothetical protein
MQTPADCHVTRHRLSASLRNKRYGEGVPLFGAVRRCGGKAGASIETFFAVELVARDRGVDGAGPGIDSSGEGLGVLETLVAEPHSDVQRAGPVVAENDYLLIWIEFGMGAAGDVSHGHKERVGKAGGLELPGFTYV